MTEHGLPTGPDDAETESSSTSVMPEAEATTTGVLAVDSVLADVERIADLPLEEHLAAFERAHDSLRATLDAPPVDQPGGAACPVARARSRADRPWAGDGRGDAGHEGRDDGDHRRGRGGGRRPHDHRWARVCLPGWAQAGRCARRVRAAWTDGLRTAVPGRG